MKELKILGSAAAGGIIIGLLAVTACQTYNPHPMFCGLMFVYALPFGAIAGAIAGAVLAARDKRGE